MSSHTPGELIGNRRVVRNTLWNLIGLGLPLMAAVIAIPLLVKGLGIERFGVLTLAWMLIGYFSLFDLGLGRALTKIAAEKLGAGKETEVPAIFWTVLTLMLLLGVVGAFIVTFLAPFLISSVLKISNNLAQETINSFYVLASGIPLVIITTGLRGLLEAKQEFGIVNVLRAPMGVLTFLGPVAVLPFSGNLVPISVVLVAVRALAWIAHLSFCFRVMPALRQAYLFEAKRVRPLLRFGGWMTVTNIVGPLMVYMDRFLIGSMISVTAVAYYVTPYEIVTKFLLVPAALVAVLFPAFSSSLVRDQSYTAQLYHLGTKAVLLALFPLALATIVFAKEGLTLWLSPEFADQGERVMQWLAMGIFLNGLAHIPFAFIQSAGRPDLTALLHLLELPLYLIALWWLLRIWGIEGAAIAWAVRAAIDAGAMFLLSPRLLPALATPALRSIALFTIVTILTLCLGGRIDGLVIKAAYFGIALSAFLGFSWYALLTPHERTLIGFKASSRHCT